MVESTDLQALVERIQTLPQLPQALAELVLALRRDELPAQHYIALIERDQALAAATLRLANSAFYGVPRRVTSIADAVQVLGLRTVCGLLSAAALHEAIRVESCPEFDFDAHRRHAMGTALAARALAARAGRDADEAFLAGLLQNLGELALAAFLPQATGRALRLAREQGRSALSAQQAVIGVSHPQVGAMVALRWHFPADIVAAIAAQQAPLPEVAPTPLPLPALVQLADHLAQALAAPDGAGSATAGAAALAPELKALCRKLGLDGPGLQTLLAQVQRDVRETLGALQPA